MEALLRCWACAAVTLLAATSLAKLDAQVQECVPPPADIVAWWPFDDTLGGISQDIVWTNNGQNIGNLTSALGMVGSALQFDGASYVAVPPSTLWAFGTTDFTIEFWANFDIPASGPFFHPDYVFTSVDDGPFNTAKWFLAASAAGLEFHVNGPNTGATFSPVVPFDPVPGSWYHIAIARSGTDYRLYINGALIGSGVNASSIPIPSSALTIGAALEPFGGFMKGRLDEVSIYRRQLRADEIQSIYLAGAAGKCKGVSVLTTSLPTAQLGVQLSQQLQATMGDPPYSWSLSGGELPPGLSLSTTGELAGTPNSLGTSSFRVRATDQFGKVGERQLAMSVSLAEGKPEVHIRKVGTIAVPGRTVDYFIVVSNQGTAAAYDIGVKEFLVAADFSTDFVTYVSASPAPDVVVDGFAILWIIPTLAPGEIRLLQYRVALNPQVPLGSSVIGEACVDTDGSPVDLDQLGLTDRAQSDPCVNKQCLSQVCFNQPAGYCYMTVECFEDCDNKLEKFPEFLKRLCKLACWPLFAECSGCIKGCSEVSCTREPAQCPTDRPDCGCHQQAATGPVDPNAKLVVNGMYIQPDETLVYPIHFQNVGAVTANDVFVSDTLDPNLDDTTLQLLTPGGSYDPTTRTVQWTLLGEMLQPGASDNVVLSIKPLPNLPSGTLIHNHASIRFEVFEPLETADVVNVIDGVRPACTVDPLPTRVANPGFDLSWTGADSVGQIAQYSVYVTENGKAPVLLTRGSENRTHFTGFPGITYGFFCVAEDTAGNAEDQSLTPEVSTVILPGAADGLAFYTLTPCRLVDTRGGLAMGGPPLSSGSARTWQATGRCGIPDTAVALTANVTIAQPTTNGHISITSAGSNAPPTSVINFRKGQTRANNTIIPLGTAGDFAVWPGFAQIGTSELVLDVAGYFAAPPP